MIAPGESSVPLCSPRSGHTATLLPDGRVLLAGGARPVTPERAAICDFDDPCSFATAEIVDPETLTSALVEPMRVPREAHTAAPIPGGVMVCGGLLSGGGCMRTPGSVERFDLARGSWSDLPPAPGLIGPSATLLASGEVLLAGGLGVGKMASGTLAWDPHTCSWSARADLGSARYLHAAALLADGRVLVAGGLGQGPDDRLVALASAAVYEPRTDSWTEAAPLHQARAEPTLTRLRDGCVLALGGYGDDPSILAAAELYDPETGTWSEVGPMERARTGHTATALAGSRVLVVGGSGGSVDAPSAPWTEIELYDPCARSFAIVASSGPRSGHTATRLDDGRVLIAGGGPQTAEIRAT